MFNRNTKSGNRVASNRIRKAVSVKTGPEKRDFLSYLFCFSTPQTNQLTPDELENKIQNLYKLCLLHINDSYRIHLNRRKGIKILEEIIEKANFHNMESTQTMSLMWCAISCVHHFFIRIDKRYGIRDWSRKRQLKRAIRTYEQLVRLTPSELYSYVMQAILTFYTESKMWNTEYLCAELLKLLLFNSYEGEYTIHAILDVAEKSSMTNVRQGRQVIRVLYQTLQNFPWSGMENNLIMRLLTMYRKSIMPSFDDAFDYSTLHKGLEVCIRNILENLPDSLLIHIIKIMMKWTLDDEVSDDALLDFGDVIEYAAMLHETQMYKDCFDDELATLIFKLIASKNRLHCLLGNRVFQFLMDRNGNKSSFDTPKIFLDDSKYNVVVNQYQSDDKAFIRRFREMFHRSLLASAQQHAVNRINLENAYTSIAILIVEIPCGYTAASIVCLAMAIQEYTISNEDIPLDTSHRLHATVMSIMSLVCWVHSAQVFYDYLKLVMSRRAQFAPHLNPPIRSVYHYAQHHILWNKPDLFFEDWEARYGLWKCFRTRHTRGESKRASTMLQQPKQQQQGATGASETTSSSQTRLVKSS